MHVLVACLKLRVTIDEFFDSLHSNSVALCVSIFIYFWALQFLWELNTRKITQNNFCWRGKWNKCKWFFFRALCIIVLCVLETASFLFRLGWPALFDVAWILTKRVLWQHKTNWIESNGTQKAPLVGRARQSQAHFTKFSLCYFFEFALLSQIRLFSRHVLCLSKHTEIQKSLVLYLILKVYVQINKSPLLHCVGVIFGLGSFSVFSVNGSAYRL